MLWSVGVGLLLLVAGLAAEKVFEGRRRWVWATVGVGTVVVTAVRLFASGGSGPEIDLGGLVITEVTAPENNAAVAWDRGRSFARHPPGNGHPPAVPADHPARFSPAHARRDSSADLAGPVRRLGAVGSDRHRQAAPTWSRDTGPAIVGLFRPRVVLPAWVADVEASKQRLILAHEEEHRRAGDGILRFAMATLLIVIPWNPFLWLHYRRLCLAIELDCDHRVVQRLPDRRWHYGDLLVRAAARRGIRPRFRADCVRGPAIVPGEADRQAALRGSRGPAGAGGVLRIRGHYGGRSGDVGARGHRGDRPVGGAFCV